MLLLFIQTSHSLSYVFLWGIGLAVLIALVLMLVWQHRQGKIINVEMSSLEKIQRHTIEHEMVLKAMRLSAWRLDAHTREITYESDYRDAVDSYTPAPGEKIEDFVKHLTPEYADKMYKLLNSICNGEIDEYNIQYQVKIGNTGRTYWAETYASVAERDDKGKPLMIVGASMRIDKRKELEDELINARIKAEESDRLKSNFLASISHEIRTPLNAIVGFSEVLPMMDDAEERQKLIGLIRENNAKLLRIFENVVTMSKVEAGNLNLKKEPFALNATIQDIAKKYAGDLDGKPIEMHCDVPEEGIVLTSDKERISVILGHFVSNAVKYTDRGSITIGYFVNPDNQLRIFVKDTGCGIPEEEFGHVFDRFIKLDTFVPGIGLGLSVCRSYANILGGNVGVDSMVGAGSTFWLDLPME